MAQLAERLMRELEFVKDRLAGMFETESVDERHDGDDYTAVVCAKLRPRPYSGSGSIALAEPDDRYPIA